MKSFEKEYSALVHPALITLTWELANIDSFVQKNLDFLVRSPIIAACIVPSTTDYRNGLMGFWTPSLQSGS